VGGLLEEQRSGNAVLPTAYRTDVAEDILSMYVGVRVQLQRKPHDFFFSLSLDGSLTPRISADHHHHRRIIGVTPENLDAKVRARPERCIAEALARNPSAVQVTEICRLSNEEI
jgi:hypothetical protein